MEDLQRDVLIKSSGMDREYLNFDIVSWDYFKAISVSKVPCDTKAKQEIAATFNVAR
jgi:hypothetical protein